jgi:toxin ParE1/3/4
MKRAAVLTSAAEEDVAEQAAWIAADNPAAANQFIDAVAETIRFVENNPLAGGRYAVRSEELRGLRKIAVTGFEKWPLFYLEREGGLLIVWLLHGARDLPAALVP